MPSLVIRRDRRRGIFNKNLTEYELDRGHRFDVRGVEIYKGITWKGCGDTLPTIIYSVKYFNGQTVEYFEHEEYIDFFYHVTNILYGTDLNND